MAPKTTKPAETASAPASTAKKPRVTPELTPASKAVAMPDVSTNRGSKTLYPFNDLTDVGMSFGVKNKTAASMASVVSNQNRKNKRHKRDAKGNTVFVMKKLTGQDGTETLVPTDKPELEFDKKFFAVDCDAAKDPDGASVRVFRSI